MAVLNMRRNGNRPKQGSVRIDRATKWGNPFVLKKGEPRGTTLRRYKSWLFHQRPELVLEARKELRNKDLSCWCKPEPCHGDVLHVIAHCDEEQWQRIVGWLHDHHPDLEIE